MILLASKRALWLLLIHESYPALIAEIIQMIPHASIPLRFAYRVSLILLYIFFVFFGRRCGRSHTYVRGGG
jgi:hypothetical protein